jgi:hypothetical protein
MKSGPRELSSFARLNGLLFSSRRLALVFLFPGCGAPFPLTVSILLSFDRVHRSWGCVALLAGLGRNPFLLWSASVRCGVPTFFGIITWRTAQNQLPRLTAGPPEGDESRARGGGQMVSRGAAPSYGPARRTIPSRSSSGFARRIDVPAAAF